jgi:FtsZ-interacting cell division protein ZipA
MAKKSAAARNAAASRRPAGAAKDQRVTLVRAPGAGPATSSDEAAKPQPSPQPAVKATATQPRPATARPSQPAASAPARPASRPAPSQSPSQPPARPTAARPATPAPSAPARMPAARPPQRGSRPVQRVRAEAVTAEHYAYVRKDLVIIAVLAACAFLILIGLYFYFRSQGQA